MVESLSDDKVSADRFSVMERFKGVCEQLISAGRHTCAQSSGNEFSGLKSG